MPYSRSHHAVIRVYDQAAISQTRLALWCCKRPIRTITRSGVVCSDDAKMISHACRQAADVCTDTLVGIPGLRLGGSRRTVAGRSAILEVNARTESVRINCPVQCG